ncbi:MAG: ABC transporter permease subunit [Anaerolineales bacterium]|nr:ABC transporter permease subunit [Anaerolineales bacterium]
MNIKAFWRDLRFLQIMTQVIFIGALVILALYLYRNVTENLARQGLTVGYGFMTNPASFDISETYIPYDASDSYRRALEVGIVNTLVVSVCGVILATIVGVFVGVSRLSSNLIVRSLAAGYVGVFRNTPLVIQLMFWYFGVVLQLPAVREAIELAGPTFLTQRGIYLPWAEQTETFAAWRVYIILGIISIIVIALALQFARKRSSLPLSPWWNMLYLIVPVAIVWFGYQFQPTPPLNMLIPELAGLNFKGGLRLTPEFTALLFGLVIYTGAFIAEVVRAGIQAVPKGQVEAARSLGFSTSQSLRLIVLPQALRVIVPPITSQYLNLAKNSSLAIAIGYPDLFSIAGTIFNQTGAAIEIIVVMMLSYLSISLFTSLLMNLYNRRIQLVER